MGKSPPLDSPQIQGDHGFARVSKTFVGNIVVASVYILALTRR